MNKEKLEEIRNRMIVEKQHFKYLNNEKGYWENVYTLLERDVKYLFDAIIEQAERVQELEEEYKVRRVEYLEEHIDRLEQQNQRYKQVLEFYADRENYEPFDGIFLSNYQNKVDKDGGEKARQALEGES